MKNVILYARVSTQKQSTQGESLSVQIDEMRRYAKGKGWNILSEFQEQFTGTSENRPEMNNAIDRIRMYKEKGINVDYLLITKIDRNSRWPSDIHFRIKGKLKDVWVELKDVQWVIQSERSAVDIQWVNTDSYDWAMYNPSETTEVFMAMSSQQERRAILQRTIPQEIRNSYEGYWTRPSVFWYETKAIISETGSRKTIQVSNTIESRWIIRLFELRAEWYSDVDIVQEINDMWYISRIQTSWDKAKTRAIWKKWGKKLNVKQLQLYIKNPIYAWIWVVTWRGNPSRVVIQKYSGLISIDLWNKANKGKKKITLENWIARILEGNELVEFPEIKRRFHNHPDFPFSNLIFADNSTKYLNWNSPKGSNGTRYMYYSAKSEHGNANYTKEIFESTIIEYIQSLEVDFAWWWNLFDFAIEGIGKIRTDEYRESLTYREDNLNWLIEKKKIINEQIGAFISFPEILHEKNLELKDLNSKIIEVQNSLSKWQEEFDNSIIKKYGKLFIENIWKIASNTKEHEVLKVIFEFIFRSTPTFWEIVNRNTPLQSFLALWSQQKILHEGEFLKNTWWQSRMDSNHGQGLWRPLH